MAIRRRNTVATKSAGAAICHCLGQALVAPPGKGGNSRRLIERGMKLPHHRLSIWPPALRRNHSVTQIEKFHATVLFRYLEASSPVLRRRSTMEMYGSNVPHN